MTKFCVFCGNKPREKNNEHIIPKWLIELTGDPNRVVEIGPILNTKTTAFENKNIAFDQFKFPSCESCNHKYSKLEIDAKKVVLRMINNEALSVQDFMILLDWLDKIRIGLWLAYNYLQKNVSEVEPNYHIEKRISNSDRAVFIYKSNFEGSRLSWGGANIPAFQYLPTCFLLTINQYSLYNLATDFLISERIGLPYSVESTYIENGNNIIFKIKEGKERIQYPLIKKPFNQKCTQIYQPIFRRNEIRSNLVEMYDNDFVRSISFDYSVGVGKIFIAENNKIKEYPNGSSNTWIPDFTWDYHELFEALGRQVLEFQLYSLNNGPRYGDISPERKKLIKERLRTAKQINRFVLGD